MSLVVAHILSDRVELTGDSRFTSGDGQHSNFFTGGLKVIVVSKTCCIAYAGIVEYGERAIREAAAHSQIDKLVGVLRDASRPDESGESDCEFIVACSDDEGRRLIKVNDGRVRSITQGRMWIGDIDAYGVFQRRFSAFPAPTSDIGQRFHDSLSLVGALKDVIRDESVASVGGVQVTVNDTGREGGFMYMPSFESQTHGFTLPPGGGRLPLTLGPGTDSLLVELKVPEERGIGAVGVYVHEAQKGAIFAPLKSSEPFQIEADSPEAFRQTVLEELGIKLMGGGVS